jgi:hypothetical protein
MKGLIDSLEKVCSERAEQQELFLKLRAEVQGGLRDQRDLREGDQYGNAGRMIESLLKVSGGSACSSKAVAEANAESTDVQIPSRNEAQVP